MDAKKFRNVSFLIIVFIMIPVLSLCNPGKTLLENLPIRKPVQAGRFYPGSPKELRSLVKNFLNTAGSPMVKGKLVALVVPHAGYVYSGQVAAYSYKELKNRSYETIILIGPSHFAFLDGAAVYPQGYYQSPLGNIPVNDKVANKIVSEKLRIYNRPSVHNSQEHSLEVQLPFLQAVMGKSSIVPIMVGQVDTEFCQDLATKIYHAIKNENALIMASSDMSHYPGYDLANKVDKSILKIMTSLDPAVLLKQCDRMVKLYYQKNLKTCLCGKWAVTTAMMAAEKLGATKVKILKYANSGDVPAGDKNSVVGYGAVAFYK